MDGSETKQNVAWQGEESSWKCLSAGWWSKLEL